jgi:hypothetical protein
MLRLLTLIAAAITSISTVYAQTTAGSGAVAESGAAAVPIGSPEKLRLLIEDYGTRDTYLLVLDKITLPNRANGQPWAISDGTCASGDYDDISGINLRLSTTFHVLSASVTTPISDVRSFTYDRNLQVTTGNIGLFRTQTSNGNEIKDSSYQENYPFRAFCGDPKKWLAVTRMVGTAYHSDRIDRNVILLPTLNTFSRVKVTLVSELEANSWIQKTNSQLDAMAQEKASEMVAARNMHAEVEGRINSILHEKSGVQMFCEQSYWVGSRSAASPDRVSLTCHRLGEQADTLIAGGDLLSNGWEIVSQGVKAVQTYQGPGEALTLTLRKQ